MATLAEELTALKTEEDKITGNKVANFSYDDYAYEHNDANGVDTYNVDNHQNIPNGTANILKVNATILTKGWRAQASAITRMLMNHFLGRCSYNLNKINDHFSALLTKLIAYIGTANGIATLDSNAKVPMNQINTAVANGIASLDSDGYVPTSQLSPTGVVKTVNGASPVNGNITKAQIGINNVVNTGDSATPVSGGTTKFTTGGAYTELAKKAPNNHASSSTTYGVASSSNYGHTKILAPVKYRAVTLSVTSLQEVDYLGILSVLSMGSLGLSIKNNLPFSISVVGVKMTGAGASALRGIESIASGATSAVISFNQGDTAVLMIIPNNSSVAGI